MSVFQYDGAKCSSASDNKYFKCPPRMDDGRHFTDYRPSCDLDNYIRVNNGIMNSNDYRMFLTRNANKLMELNRKYACDKNCCGPCKVPYNQGTMLSEQTVQTCNFQSCNTDFVDQYGLGQGRKYDNISGNCKTWPAVPIQNNVNCCADTTSQFNYYNHIDSKAQGLGQRRLTVPSGGMSLKGGDPQAYNL